MQQITIIYTTMDCLTAAEALARHAIEQEVAACVNIIPVLTSVYKWQGKVETSQECALIFKVSCEKAANLRAWIKRHHSYDVPAILSGDVNVLEDFYKFVQSR
ncbi:divalent-cation tolerance protein CutA [Candidatus Odyssella thessalonicensis]|uniref:divalent-cation tolerance protein CutA n=1 Tax=Candidatus Odyssella thessalonicensis TaxID=84647 RepID=UPI000225AC33|nr:divalent-cation tolerance protein CutA [Candidatus Odyssella thessalonicensis]